MWAISSVGRAPPLQGGGHWFEPGIAHHFIYMDILFKYFWKDSKPVQEIDLGSDFLCLKMLKKYFIINYVNGFILLFNNLES